MIETEYAWAAGFIDGEGCFHLTNRRKYLRLTVGQVRPEPLYRLKEVLGGSISGPRDNGRGQPTYTYRLCSRELGEQIDNIWPYLSRPKREQFLQKMNEALTG